MAASGSVDDIANEESLTCIFLKGLALHDRLQESAEDFRSEAFQNEVRKGIMLLEDCTRMVSLLELFSTNEQHTEVSTQSLKYFLLPVLLGNLNAKLQEDHERRLEMINIIQTYYMDFLARIRDYEIIDWELPKLSQGEESAPPPSGPPDLAKMNAERDQKLRRYKQKKELDSQLQDLKVAAENEHRDDETVRKYYLTLIRTSALSCMDEISSYEMEKPILAHMAKLRKGEVVDIKPNKPKPRPLKPIIITKDKIQKEVFGMGYKNLPVLSIEEFYEQRVRDGWFPDPATVKANSLIDQANQDPEVIKQKEDEEEREKDLKEEQDDEEELARKRNWDEYKDDHKRGEGNMHNKG